MNDDDDVSSGLGRSSWLELAESGGMLLRHAAAAFADRPPLRASRARRRLLALTSDGGEALPSPS